MNCSNCGKKVDANSKFCIHCGNKTEKTEQHSDELLSINVSKTQTLVFYPTYLVYKGEKITYSDVQGMAYLFTRTRHSINFIPTHTSNEFTIKLEANGKVYNVGSSSAGFMFFQGQTEKDMRETFGKLVYVLDHVIKPFVLLNLLAKFDREKQIKIGDITINSQGLSRKRFLIKPDFINWDQFYNAVLHQGSLQILRQDTKKKYKMYFALSMSLMNAVVMPEFLGELYRRYSTPEQEVKKIASEEAVSSPVQLEEKVLVQNEKQFCWSCAGPVNKGQKFCTHCGSKLK